MRRLCACRVVYGSTEFELEDFESLHIDFPEGAAAEQVVDLFAAVVVVAVADGEVGEELLVLRLEPDL